MMVNGSELCIIDRFEGDFAVIEFKGRIMFNIPKSLLPEDSSEGDVVTFNVAIDYEETNRRRRQVEELAKGIFVDE